MLLVFCVLILFPFFFIIISPYRWCALCSDAFRSLWIFNGRSLEHFSIFYCNASKFLWFYLCSLYNRIDFRQLPATYSLCNCCDKQTYMHGKLEVVDAAQQFNSRSLSVPHTHKIEINAFTYCARLDPSNAQSWKNRASHTSKRMRHWNWINQCVAAIRCRKTISWSFANIFSFFCASTVHHSTLFIYWRFLSFQTMLTQRKTGRTAHSQKWKETKKRRWKSAHFFPLSSPKFNAINKPAITCNVLYMEFILCKYVVESRAIHSLSLV